MNNTPNHISITNPNRKKSTKRHIVRILIIQVILIGGAFFKGLFTSGNVTQTVIVFALSILSILYTVYIIKKSYYRTIASIDFIEPNSYKISYNKWFNREAKINVCAKNIDVKINKVDPNSGTVGFSKITFLEEGKVYSFQVTLSDLKKLLLFFDNHFPLNLSMSVKWDIKEISNYAGFEELKELVI